MLLSYPEGRKGTRIEASSSEPQPTAFPAAAAAATTATTTTTTTKAATAATPSAACTNCEWRTADEVRWRSLRCNQ